MCVAAHPDDEDGTTLTVLRRRDGVHTVSLFSTFGEGGQNAVGPELYEELGVIRVHETMMASQIQGSEPYFLGLKDFGFSKSADEAFKEWGHDEALRRMVLKIRELRPDVIITNHNTTSGHGHHQATGRLIIEAFDAAADASRFPEQLNKFKPWQAKRLFVRGFGSENVAADKTFAVDPNEIDPVRGSSFAEQALAALQQHATQGPWPKSVPDLLRARRIESGKLPPIRYRLLKEAAGVPALPANATTPLAGLELSQAIAERLTPPTVDGKPLTDFLDRPDRVLAALVDWQAVAIRAYMNDADGGNGAAAASEAITQEAPRLQLFAARADQAIATAAGISLTLKSSTPVLVPGTRTTFSIDLANTGMNGIHVNAIRFTAWEKTVPVETADLLLPDTETVVNVDSDTPKAAPITVPSEEHLYDGLFLGKNYSAVADLEIDGAKFSVGAQLSRDVAPAVEIKKISPPTLVWTPGRRDQVLNFTAVVRNNLPSQFRGTLEINSKALGISAVGAGLTLAANEMRSVALRSNTAPVVPTRSRRGSTLTSNWNFASLIVEDRAAAMISKRTVPVVFSDARVVAGLRVGYVASFDQTLEQSLAALGVNSKPLSVDAIKSSELSEFDTIIIDNRGYEAHPELIAQNSRLLDFVNAGGTLVVFYHKSDEWNPNPGKNRPQLAPYPIVLGNERVTDETAAINFLVPRHPLLNVPNKITQADFANWIQERGLYYPKEWDSHYTALFSTNDPGEAPLKGGLLVAPYGKGNYVYTSMVWYRELRAGVPGAYRMFANMISYR